MSCRYQDRRWDNGWCPATCMYCTATQEEYCEHKHQTNADRIRAMSDEELAGLLEGDYGTMMPGTALLWLRQPAEEGGGDDGAD